MGLWRNPDFTLLWGSQSLSDLGTSISQLATPLLVLSLTHSPVQAGVVGTVAQLVGLACRAPSGVAVDRVNRRLLMMGCDLARLAATTALVVALLAGYHAVGLIAGVAAVGAAGRSVFDTAERSALRSLVGTGALPAAVARNEARSYAVALAGPPLGGLLFGIARALPFLADAVSYLLSLLGLALIRRPMNEERTGAPEPGYAGALAEGTRFVLTHPFLRALLLLAAPLNFALNGALFALIVVLQRHGTAPAVIGTVETVFAVGGLLGAFAAARLIRAIRLSGLVISIGWLSVVMLAGSALLTGSVLAAVPLAVTAFVAPAANAGLFGYQAAITPDRLQGRVVSVILLAATSASAFAPIMAGAVINQFGGAAGLLVFAGAALLSALVATGSSAVRTLRPVDEPARTP